MKIYSSSEKIEYSSPCIALGNFDGLHLGHQKVINAAKEYGDSFGVLLFDIHSEEILGNRVKIITNLDEKLNILERLGMDFAVIVNFDDDFKNKSCEEFAGFIKGLGVKSVSVGYDYRCAKGAAAGCDELGTALAKLGIDLIVSEPVKEGGILVKSSKIRELLEEGNISLANRLLTRAFSITGIVSEGKQNGRLMGFPTANLSIDENRVLPKDGVYVGECVIDKAYRVILNIGNNPTFNADNRTVEAHIIGFDGDIYGSILSIDIWERLRDCKRFSSPDELAKQLKADRAYAISIKGE